MHCPGCGKAQTEVIESRPRGEYVIRRRRCLSCEHRFTTWEIAVSPGKFPGKKTQTAVKKLIACLRALEEKA